MANNWNIPGWLEKEVRDRDKVCVYCGQPFLSPKVSSRSSASWEHIINDASIVTRENIALCCRGCNASKGQRKISDWLQTQYCKEKGITEHTVAPIIRTAISNGQ
ncbi:MAG: HNH endonuclease [Geobacteraceae bacterium]|nr:HNH endonuclease [Geobacteraceae bacterium]